MYSVRPRRPAAWGYKTRNRKRPLEAQDMNTCGSEQRTRKREETGHKECGSSPTDRVRLGAAPFPRLASMQQFLLVQEINPSTGHCANCLPLSTHHTSVCLGRTRYWEISLYKRAINRTHHPSATQSLPHR